MEKIAPNTFLVLLAIACVAQASAQLPFPPDVGLPIPNPDLPPLSQIPRLPVPLPPWFPFPQIPKLGAPDSAPGTPGKLSLDDSKFEIPGLEFGKCFKSLWSIEGCYGELQNSLFTGRFDRLGHACCKSVLTINDNCWPKMFPFTPLFPTLLKNYCSKA